MNPPTGPKEARTELWSLLITVALAASMAFLAGCLGEAPSTDAIEDDAGAGSTQFSVSLDDIPQGSDWILIEAIPKQDTILEGRLDVDLHHSQHASQQEAPADQAPRDACLAADIGLANIEPIILQASEHGMVVKAGPAQADARAGPLHGEQTSTSIDLGPHPAEEGERIPLLFGLDGAHAWGEAAEITATVHAREPVAWTVVDHGSMGCATGPEDFDEGTVVHAHASQPLAMRAEELSATRTFDRAGFGYVFVDAASGYDVSIQHNRSTEWEHGKETSTTIGWMEHRFDVPPGQLEVKIPHLTGTASTTAGYLLLDLPSWALGTLENTSPSTVATHTEPP